MIMPLPLWLWNKALGFRRFDEVYSQWNLSSLNLKWQKIWIFSILTRQLWWIHKHQLNSSRPSFVLHSTIEHNCIFLIGSNDHNICKFVRLEIGKCYRQFCSVNLLRTFHFHTIPRLWIRSGFNIICKIVIERVIHILYIVVGSQYVSACLCFQHFLSFNYTRHLSSPHEY